MIQRLIDDDNSVALAQNNQHDLFSRPHQTPVSIHNLARSSPFNVSGDLNHILAGNDHFQRFFNHALHNPGSSFGHRASTNQYLHGGNL